jgi:hypothetical protein
MQLDNEAGVAAISPPRAASRNIHSVRCNILFKGLLNQPIKACSCAPYLKRGNCTMLPDVGHPIWLQIVTGERTAPSTRATFNLLIQNNKMSHEKDPSPENTARLIAKTHSFFTKYEVIFSNEISTILK